MQRLIPITLVIALSAGCGDQPTSTGPIGPGGLAGSVVSASESGKHVVLLDAEAIPSDLEARVEALGGRMERALSPIGVAIVSGLTPEAAQTLSVDAGVTAVEADVSVPFMESVETTTPVDVLSRLALHSQAAPAAQRTADAPQLSISSPTSALLYPRQWHLRTVQADAAWAAGHFGSRKVVVAILDTGIDYLHPDLEGLVDLSRSVSLVPEDDAIVATRYPGRHSVTDLFYHGTASSAIIASNARILAGINREVTLIGVKVAGRNLAVTSSAIIAGLVHAVDNGAHIINLSGGPYFDDSDTPGLATSFRRAFRYVSRKGVLFVSGPGNDTTNHDTDGDMIRMCELSDGICTSATGPTSAATVDGPWTDVDGFGLYSGYGRSIIDVAAPGGQRFTFTRVWVPCTTTPSEFSPAACRATGAPIEQRLVQGIGTSWAVPHVVGLAALLMAQQGTGNPHRIRATILNSADDRGEPGRDPYYGRGRINIARALGLARP